jgi:hypothetical protein
MYSSLMSKITKCNLKPIVIGDDLPNDYDDPLFTKEMDEPTLAGLIKTIPKLDKKAHECIYEIVRAVKPKDFFAINGLGTHFNILNLNNRIKWEIYRLCQMSLNDQSRKDVIKNADTLHGTTIEHLENNLTKLIS